VGEDGISKKILWPIIAPERVHKRSCELKLFSYVLTTLRSWSWVCWLVASDFLGLTRSERHTRLYLSPLTSSAAADLVMDKATKAQERENKGSDKCVTHLRIHRFRWWTETVWDVISHANDVVRRRGYSDHFVTMCVYVCVCVSVYVSPIKRKPLIAMTWNLA